VITALRSPSRRILIAIALSAMFHVAILGLPQLQSHHRKVPPPPLTARLELLPKPVTPPPATLEQKNLSGKPEVSSPGKPKGSALVDQKPDKPINESSTTMKQMEKSDAFHQFPKHLRLAFNVYKGAEAFKIGEIQQQLDIFNDRYTLIKTRQIIGLARLMNNDQLAQTSLGKIDANGLQPVTFIEERISTTGKQNLKATFDWAAQKLNFSQGGDTALPAEAQDILSFTYQLSQLSMRREIIPLDVSDGVQLAQVRIEIRGTEDLSTPMGNLRALHLRKMHTQGEPYFEIWLGLKYRMLPIKFRQVDASGKIIEEDVISDIRASDE
jgi:hypothetical protein